MVKKGTGEAAKPNRGSKNVSDIVSRVGQKILRLRSERGLSLQQLAAKSDVSSPAIHKIERNGMVPTITTLLKLSNALDVSVKYFVEEDEAAPEPVRVTRKGKRESIYTPHKGLDLEGITGPYKQFRTAAAIAQMNPRANSGSKLLKHSGEELVHVLSGEVSFHLGNNSYTLQAGDSLHFSGEIPHQWANTTDKPAKLVWVVLRDE